MSSKYGILVVEGPTDQAVVRRALQLLGLKSFGGQVQRLDSFWNQAKIIPTYPPRSGNLYERLPMPSILSDATCSVAIYEAGGSSRLVPQIRELLDNHDLHKKLDLFGVIADADDKPAVDVASRYQREFQDLFPAFPPHPGHVVAGPPALGAFVFPDNVQQGVVEHLVLECGEAVYSTHLQRARRYVGEFSLQERQQAGWAPFDEQKAIIASVASLLKPGKTNVASIADNLWVSEQTRGSAMLIKLLDFLNRLMGRDSAVI